jgi:phasin
MTSMSDTAMRNDTAAKPKVPKNATSPGTTFETPKFEVPKFEVPVAFRELAEKNRTQTKENYEKMRTAAEKMVGMAEATGAIAVEGAKVYGLKVIEITGANANAAFDFVGKLMTAKSLSEVVEFSTAHAREQFNAVSTQNKELLALAQKIGTDAVEPIKEGMSKAFERNA